MLAKRIIAALDVRNGRVVKGVQFQNVQDAGDPAECAAIYDAAGVDELVLLDIDASAENRGIMIDTVRKVAKSVSIPFTVGGGVRSVEDFSMLLHAGAEKVFINSAAVNSPGLLRAAAEIYGRQCVVVAIDAKRQGSRWEVYTHGGRRPTGMDAVDWARYVVRQGAGELLVTSMDADGTKAGFDVELTRAIASGVEVPVIASGGAGEIKHFYDVLTVGEAEAALAASLFHYGEMEIRSLKQALKEQGLCMRV